MLKSTAFLVSTLVMMCGCRSGSDAPPATEATKDAEPAAAEAKAASPEILGSLPKEAIEKVINANKAAVRACYETALKGNPKLAGRIVLNWKITPEGKVNATAVKESSLGDDSVGTCIVAEVNKWAFDKPSAGGVVEVNYPFVFKPG